MTVTDFVMCVLTGTAIHNMLKAKIDMYYLKKIRKIDHSTIEIEALLAVCNRLEKMSFADFIFPWRSLPGKEIYRFLMDNRKVG